MKKYTAYLFGLIFLITFFLLPSLALAHFPATDNTITVTLHVEPNDSPIPQEQANLYLLFNDATDRFDLKNCNCVLTIMESGKLIYAQQLIYKLDPNPSIWGSRIPFIFPNRDIYHIALIGKPKIINQFQPFNLSWDFRVDQYSKNSEPSLTPILTKYLLVSLMIGFGLQGVILLISKLFGRKKRDRV